MPLFLGLCSPQVLRTSTNCWPKPRSALPFGELVDIMDVGFACAYLATPYARRITVGTIYVDGGANIRV